ncbi:FRG domain-containing protein [Kocuria massiliensis]|uniref:FRG domain-containing protein n=1 Tax=Kocuria massiliensis TaxID=1926282 RepID=UPI0022B9747E|nr:FRG domain-containing protein [Kocuria massiliensis]
MNNQNNDTLFESAPEDLKRELALLEENHSSRINQYLDSSESPIYYKYLKEGVEGYFEANELVINSFDELHKGITTLISKTPDLPLVWRGVKDSSWGLHSSLFRELMEDNGVENPKNGSSSPQFYPDEAQMINAEKQILKIARHDWRFDNLSALETFARIQHAGGPTRLIDVTKNPYIGAWFAVESDKYRDNEDARLFAIATHPVSKPGEPLPPNSELKLDALGASREPFWHYFGNNRTRTKFDWGTGARRRIWVPPIYDPRISAQNAAFLIDGVPITSQSVASYFTVSPNVYWSRADLLASSSIYAKMYSPKKTPRPAKTNLAPTFSFRITAKAKEEIRLFLESRFGYRSSYLYPDMAGIATFISKMDFNS